MTDKHLFADMTWPEVNEAVAQRRVALIPVGAIEQHGPHLPVDVDNVLAVHICNEVARRSAATVLAMPPIHYGYNDHNMDFPGTISIRMQHFVDYGVDVGASLAHQGFRHILYVNAHGSNAPLCDLIARRITVETEALAAAINHWQVAWDVIAGQLEGGPYAADHACEWETSEYLAVAPGKVQMDKAIDEIPADRGGPRWLYPDLNSAKQVHFMNYWSRMNTSGVSGTPTRATAEKGRVMLDATIERLLTIARQFRDLEIAPRVDHRLQPAPPEHGR
ncbi:MAG: creatininase family protein [Acidisphaera sp.]|nr:creatininase family protein [Acidisphaera sp.]